MWCGVMWCGIAAGTGKRRQWCICLCSKPSAQPPPASSLPPHPCPTPLLTALLNSATIAIFQGSPLGRPFGQFIERARVTALGLVPSIVKVGW